MTLQDIPDIAAHTVFIVDDDPGSQQLLADTLSREGYATHCLSNGKLALQAALAKPPDLILLDVMMPGIDGFEVCRLLKENPATRFVPVVMVTCLNEKEMKLKGIAAGADDFISKPIDTTEILLRTRNLLLVKQYFDVLKDQSGLLEQQVRLRTEALEKAIDELKSTQQQMVQQEKMAMIGQLTAGIAHELNNPIGFIASNVGSLGKYCEKLLMFIKAQQETLLSRQPDQLQTDLIQEQRSRLKIDYIIKDIPEMILETQDGVERIKSIVRDLKCFSHVDESEQKLADINHCLESTLNIINNELKYKAQIKREYGDLPQLLCCPQQLGQVFMNLLINAGHAIDTKGEITVRSWNAEGRIFVSISDTGCGIPEQQLARIFEPFFTTKEAGKGTGLGLAISNEIVKNHGGEIRVESEPGKGSTFTVSIPLERPHLGQKTSGQQV